MREPSIRPMTRRRLMFAGAGSAGALAAAASVIPLTKGEPAPDSSAAKAAIESGGGYQVTQHVLRYYETAKV